MSGNTLKGSLETKQMSRGVGKKKTKIVFKYHFENDVWLTLWHTASSQVWSNQVSQPAAWSAAQRNYMSPHLVYQSKPRTSAHCLWLSCTNSPSTPGTYRGQTCNTWNMQWEHCPNPTDLMFKSVMCTCTLDSLPPPSTAGPCYRPGPGCEDIAADSRFCLGFHYLGAHQQ